MTVRELVVKLVLNASGFQDGIDDARKGLDGTRDATDKAGRGIRELGQRARKTGDDLEKAGKKGEDSFKAFADVLAKVAAFFGGAALLGAGFKSYVDAAVDIERTADSLGMSMKELQAWQNVAKAAGSDAEEMSERFRDMADYITDAAKFDSGPLKDIAKELGISLTDATGKAKSAQDVMLELADAFSRIDPQEAMGYGRQMGFDPATIALLQKGRGELESLLKVQKERAVYTKEDAALAKKAQLAMQTFMEGVQALGAMLMRLLGPALTWVAEKLADFVDWVRKNEKSVIVFLSALAAIITVAMIPALWGMATAAAAALAPFTPFILLIGAIALAIDDLMVYLEGGESEFASFWSMLGTGEEIAARLSAIWEGFKTVLSSLIDVAKAVGRILVSIFTLDGAGLVKGVEKLIDGFAGLGKVLANIFGYIKEKLKSLLPGWALKLLGWGGDEGGGESQDAAQGEDAAQEVAPSVDPAQATPQVGPGEPGPAMAGPTDNSRTVTTTTTVQSVTINTQATDAEGIAKDFDGALRNQTAQSDGAWGV